MYQQRLCPPQFTHGVYKSCTTFVTWKRHPISLPCSGSQSISTIYVKSGHTHWIW